MPDLKLELEPSPRMAKLASFELELEYSSRPGLSAPRHHGRFIFVSNYMFSDNFKLIEKI